MKMDTEGHEPDILEGAHRLFTHHRVWYFMLELNTGELNKYRPDNQKRLIDLLVK